MGRLLVGSFFMIAMGSAVVLSGLKTCVGSMLSSTRVRRRDGTGFEVDDSLTTFFGRPLLFTGAGAGSGVKSTS